MVFFFFFFLLPGWEWGWRFQSWTEISILKIRGRLCREQPHVEFSGVGFENGRLEKTDRFYRGLILARKINLFRRKFSPNTS